METKKQRTIPSGKVYKQIFDAEVQLVKALEQTKKKKEGCGDVDEDVKEEMVTEGDAGHKDDITPHIPLVKHSRGEGGPGILNDRQKTWTAGFPNEVNIENPVIYKYYSDKLREGSQEQPCSVASHEVQTLPDVVIPGKPKSDIIERIAASRKDRHESSLEDMHQELGIVSSDLEPRIQEAGEMLITRLEANNQEIDQIMARIEKDEDLVLFMEEGLVSVWDEVAIQSEYRQTWIKEMDEALAKIEEDRISMVREIFRVYSEQLEKIAHLMLPDLHRLLDKDSQVINQTLLSNKRAYADLYSRIMMHDIEREKKLHTTWCTRLADWKRLHTDRACKEFREFVESDDILAPAGVAKVMEFWRAEQQALNGKRLTLVQSLSNMKPPASTKTAVYQWNEQITEISKHIDKLNQSYFTQLYGEYERVCQQCLEQVDIIKLDLIDRGIATEAAASAVVQQQCLPLVGKLQTGFEKSLEEMDRKLESHNNAVLTSLKSMFKFSQGAAHMWDVHELGLAKQERALQEKLDAARHQHDNTNQDLEANLDITMDRMRQDGGEHHLKESLKKALDMMNKIKEGYFIFHKDQTDIVAQYPGMVEEELTRYDAAVCHYFGVDRKHPDEAKEEERESLSRSQSRSTKKNPRPKETPRPDNQGAEEADAMNLPLVVREVLSTAKGTTFYVLTVAGEHGVPPPGGDEKMNDGEKEIAEQLEEYLQAVIIPDDVLTEVKKQILMNFLEHLEDWRDSAIKRSNSVVIAKSEELNSELDLRLHLHEPRPRRAELDVHNVRAAELVMHNERVVRHCKGINQALAELKHRFNQMTQHHNQLANQFRADIESLETIFITATKSSNLVSLSSQLQAEQDKYMDVVRASLRQFRQHLDDTLQMLRQSNARFIKSFKLFSDGGNFCPEEIEDYRKRLEKMSQKIDTSEGFIMADLEGMESKRLDQASKVANEFQDRFKHHMIDLVFMEKIARWLTNTQVKIKAEVADSNSQAQRLSQMLSDLERRIDACEKPNLDKEEVSPTQLNDSLIPIFTAFHERSAYLNTNKEVIARPPSAAAALQGNPALGGRVGFTSDVVTPISKPGKQPIEDASVAVIKTILKTQKDRLQYGTEVNVDEDIPIPTAQVPVKGREVGGGEGEGEKSKSRQSQVSNGDSKSRRSSGKPGTATTSSDSTPKRGTSGTVFRPSKGQKVDRKYFVFGEAAELDEDVHFLGKIKHVLRDALDGLLAAAELYYRQKGNRAVTRPQALQETFDLCADAVVQKTQSYYVQADSYHNQCLQELRVQLTQFETLSSHVPGCVIREMLKTFMQSARQRRTQLSSQFNEKLTAINRTKEDHQVELRPTLGHPQQAPQLAQLCDREVQRHSESVSAIQEYASQQQALAVEEASKFVGMLASTSENLLLQFDGVLTVDDVNRGRVPPTKHATSELVRRHKAGNPLHDDEDKDKLPRGKRAWQGIPKDDLTIPSKDATQVPPQSSSRKGRKKSVKDNAHMTASVTTAKTTLGHSAAVQARDKAYQDYKQYFTQTLSSIDDEQEKQSIAEDRWTASWQVDVDKVKSLY